MGRSVMTCLLTLIFTIVLAAGSLFFPISGISANKDQNARKNLIEKYRSYEKIRQKLEFILLKGKMRTEGIRDVFIAVHDLNEDKSKKMTEVLVDLIDFHIGEVMNHDIYEHISTRDKKEVYT